MIPQRKFRLRVAAKNTEYNNATEVAQVMQSEHGQTLAGAGLAGLVAGLEPLPEDGAGVESFLAAAL